MDGEKRIKRKHNDKENLRNRILNFKIEQSLLDKVKDKCKKENISMSQYLFNLVDSDLNNVKVIPDSVNSGYDNNLIKSEVKFDNQEGSEGMLKRFFRIF